MHPALVQEAPRAMEGLVAASRVDSGCRLRTSGWPRPPPARRAAFPGRGTRSPPSRRWQVHQRPGGRAAGAIDAHGSAAPLAIASSLVQGLHHLLVHLVGVLASRAQLVAARAVQAAIEAEFAPEINRFETVFDMAARRAASDAPTMRHSLKRAPRPRPTPSRGLL